jgi:hypothetical protein
MATIQELLTDIDLRYRNTFTTAQKIVWMNEEQTDLFEIFEIDSPPYNFTLVADTYFYPIPAGVDIDKIKTIAIQIDDAAEPNFDELPFKRNDDRQFVSESEYWYTIVEDNFYINVPGDIVTGRNVYVYFDSAPTEISSSSVDVEPSTPKRYQEILKLGTLERICAARKDIAMKNNFANEKEAKIADVEWRMKMSEPEWITPADYLPNAGRNRRQNQRAIWITQTE